MDSEASRKQLENIRSFILLEAREKADEIRMKAKGDADKERQELVLSAKNKIAADYDRKEKQLAMDQRIQASMQERKQRARLLEKRDAYMSELGKEAAVKMTAVASSNAKAYHNLLQGLIKQGLTRLAGDNKVDVRCRPQDADVVRTLAPAAAASLVAELKAAGEERAITVTVTPDAALASSAGGVIVSSLDGRIKCNNTLEERLKLAMADLQPVIRDLLFPSARAEPRAKPPVTIHGHSAAIGTSVPGEAAAAAAAATRASAAAAARAAAGAAAAAPAAHAGASAAAGGAAHAAAGVGFDAWGAGAPAAAAHHPAAAAARAPAAAAAGAAKPAFGAGTFDGAWGAPAPAAAAPAAASSSGFDF